MQPEARLKLTLESTISPSEDRGKVLSAMKNILGDCSYSVDEGESVLRISSEDMKSLERLHDQLRDRHVRAAARRLLLAAREGDRTAAMVNRQAAAAGVTVLCSSAEESPLGPIYLTIESPELDAIVRWLTAYEEG